MTEEGFRGGVHATVATLLAVMAAYNAMRLAGHGTRRNVLNVAIYLPLMIYEWRQARFHWSHP